MAWTVDVFGNLVATATFADPNAELTITREAVVEHGAREWPVFAIDPSAHAYPLAYSLDDLVDLGALAQPDWLKPGGERIGEWARGFVPGPVTSRTAGWMTLVRARSPRRLLPPA